MLKYSKHVQSYFLLSNTSNDARSSCHQDNS